MHSDNIVQLFDEILNEKKCHDLCRKYQFIKRSSSKLKGQEFIKAMIIPSKGSSTDSLKGLCQRLRKFNDESELSSQALCKRLNGPASSRLMKGVLNELLMKIHEQIIYSCPKLAKGVKGFNRILVEDSSIAVLNEKLDKKYPGTNRGGCSGKAQVKIDVITDISKGILVDAQLFRGNEPDRGFAERILSFIKKGDLIIRDLGYFTINAFKAIAAADAYFLSRLLPGVLFFLNKNDENPLDIGTHLKKKIYRNKNIIGLKGFLGKDKTPIRLIMYRNPDEVVNQRLREANKKAKSRGTTMSKSKRLSLYFSMFITNAPEEMMSDESIGTIYRLRWEVELIFKRWKSQLEIDYLKGINENRIDCLIWSRLCSISIVELISSTIKYMVNTLYDLEVSEVKLISYLLRESGFYYAFAENRLETFFDEMIKDIPRMLLKDRRHRKTMREKVFYGESYYEMQHFDFQSVVLG
jgi:Transposase DDE domain